MLETTAKPPLNHTFSFENIYFHFYQKGFSCSFEACGAKKNPRSHCPQNQSWVGKMQGGGS